MPHVPLYKIDKTKTLGSKQEKQIKNFSTHGFEKDSDEYMSPKNTDL